MECDRDCNCDAQQGLAQGFERPKANLRMKSFI